MAASSRDGRMRRLFRSRRGSVAVEMALIGPPLILAIIGIMEVSFDIFARLMLDNALAKSVRIVETGNAQNTATSLATFQTNVFCPALAGLLDCSAIAVNVTPVSTLFATSPWSPPLRNGSFDPGGFSYCPGSPSQLMRAQAVYAAPTFISQMIPDGLGTYGNQPVRLITATVGFVNEPFTATAPAPAGC